MIVEAIPVMSPSYLTLTKVRVLDCFKTNKQDHRGMVTIKNIKTLDSR